MADTDALIDSLRTAGERTSSGVFTLDPVKAREKLREFQLADPHRYVLLLVQALVLRGATRIDVVVDTDDLRMSSDARPFSFEEITDLYTLLFAEEGARAGLRELALALNAAMATDPRYLRLECAGPDATDGVRLEQRNDQQDKVERLTGIEPGVRVHVRERFRLGLVKRFFALSSDIVREQLLLRLHCAFAGIEVTLGGKPITKRKAADDVPSWHAVVLGDREIGEVGLSQAGDKGKLELVRHHVWLTTHALDNSALVGLRGTIDVSHLRTDASLADVVRDEAYYAVLDAVHVARDAALAAAARMYRNGDGVFVGPVREVLCRRIGDHLARPDADHGVEPLRDWLDVALWHTIAGNVVTSRSVLESGTARYSSNDARPAPLDVADIVFAKGRAAELFVAAFGKRAMDCTAIVARARLRDENRRAFEARLHAAVLPDGTRYVETSTFEDEHAHGAMGWSPNAGPSWMRFIVENKLLVELPIQPELGTLHVVVEAAFTPTELVDDVVRDEAFNLAVHACIAAHARFIHQICGEVTAATRIPSHVTDGLLRFVLAVLDGTHARAWLTGLGLTAAAADELCTRLGKPWEVGILRDDTGEVDHPFAFLPLFEDAGGAPVHLHRIVAAHREDKIVRIVTAGRPLLRSAPFLVVRVGELRLSVLQALFGKANVRRVGREYEGWLARERFIDTIPTKPLQLETQCLLGPLQFVHDGEIGVIGLASAPEHGATSEQTPVTPFVQSRPIATQYLGPTLTGIVAALSLPERALDHACNGLDPVGVVQATRMLATGLGAFLGRFVDPQAWEQPIVRRIVMDAIALACPAPAYMLAWMRLGTADPGEHVARYLALLAIGDERDPAALHNAISTALARQESVDAKAIRSGLANATAKRSPWSITRAAAARRLPELLAVPLFVTGSGRPLALREVIAAIEGHGHLGWVQPTPDLPASLADVVQLDSHGAEALRGIFGASKLRDRTPEIAVARQRLAFEQRPTLPDLALSAGATLVTIVVEIAGIRGTIGVPKREPTAGPGKVTITHGRRPIIDVDPTPPTAWLGVIDGDGFGEESDFEGLTERERERITEIFEAHRSIVVSALCAAGFVDGDADLRRRWVQHLAHALLPLAGFQRASLERAEIAELGNARLFIDADGEAMTLAELGIEHERHGDLAIVHRAGLRTDRRLVLVRDDIELALLRHLFGALVDAEPLAMRRLEFEARRDDASPLPTPPSDAIAVDTIDSRGLAGALWLTATPDPTVALGIDGRTLSQWPGSRMFPCAGAITGEGVTIADDFTGCALSRSREDYLKSRAALLYVRLAASIRDACPPVDDPRSFLLRELLLRLHEIARDGRKWPSHDMRRLYRDLQDAPLLPLANGRAVSLRAATTSRPAELEILLDGGEGTREAPVDDGGEAPATPEPTPMPSPVVIAPRSAPVVLVPPKLEPVIAPTIEPTTPPTTFEPPPPPPPPPEHVLRDAIRAELRLLHRRDMSLVTEPHLDRIIVADLDGRRIATRAGPRILVDATHPIVARALAPGAEVLLVSVIASAALTALNFAFEDVSDADEARLLRLHAEHLLTAAH